MNRGLASGPECQPSVHRDGCLELCVHDDHRTHDLLGGCFKSVDKATLREICTSSGWKIVKLSCIYPARYHTTIWFTH